MNKILIVVDIQNDFVNGPLGTKEAQEIIPKVVDFLKREAIEYKAIYYTEDRHNENYLNTHEGQYIPVHCQWVAHDHRKTGLGCDIVDDIIEATCGIELNEHLVGKNSFGYSKWATLDSFLNYFPIDRIDIIGLCTDICVISNALILRSLFSEIPITVYSNLCAGTTPEMHEKALDVMKSCLIDIKEYELNKLKVEDNND